MIPRVAFREARGIRSVERDRELDLNSVKWPKKDLPGWERGDGYYRRTIKAGKDVAVELDELILRFPSAPIHGLQRLHSHHVSLGKAENLHTFRVLRSADEAAQAEPVSRIFLFNTGLNERAKMGLYYTLASNLVAKDEKTVCIVRPFPGHLTRFPFQAFAETPLDRYLWDGSHLFRQFLRYMIETQWLLSTLARRSSYRYASGANLLAEAEDVGGSRLDTPTLTEEIKGHWIALQKESDRALKETFKRQPRAPKVGRKPADSVFEAAVSTVREVLNFKRDYPGWGGGDQPDETVDPALHVVGYSLGGFTAQSIFMSWPFLISSCSTLLGGGALRQLAPSAFAHPEEWQTVLHSLRYELDALMMSDGTGIEPDSIAGISLDLFTFFQRTFYEVFQQDYPGSFRSRLAAFRKRMFFVVGGNDPIVSPKSVLDSAPPGGLNMLEIGGIGHFLDSRSEDPEEERQREFWVPEMSSLISRFADGAAGAQAKERAVTGFDEGMQTPVHSAAEVEAVVNGAAKGNPAPKNGRLTAAELLAIGSDGALPGGPFERCLDDLLVRVSPETKEEGFLFMLRNEVPTLLLDPSAIREHAAALYHDDAGIVRYCHGIERRRELVEDNIPRVSLVLPWNARHILETMDRQLGYPSQAETAGGQVQTRVTADDLWSACVKKCNQLTQLPDGQGSIRMFDGKQKLTDKAVRATVPDKLMAVAERNAGGDDKLKQVAALPDCWLWISRDVLKPNYRGTMSIDDAIDALSALVPDYVPDDEEEQVAQDSLLLDQLRNEQIRIITLSRARYNPRFRGRLIVTPKPARTLLVHAAMCLSLSTSVANQKLSSVFL
jgi:hypothetical protein